MIAIGYRLNPRLWQGFFDVLIAGLRVHFGSG